MTISFEDWKRRHNSQQRKRPSGTDRIRMGQAFCNQFIKNPWPDLFYESVDKVSEILIRRYLMNNQYFPDMPTPLVPVEAKPVVNAMLLDLDDATEAAALQNFERDVRKGLLQKSEWEQEALIYRAEARHALLTDGMNYLPDYSDHPHIKLKNPEACAGQE